MQSKHISFEEVYDLLAVRIILSPKETENEKANCWVTYSAITSIYKAHPERTRDWLSTPKSNGYEALHVTVMGPGGNWIEVQIRSERMNDIAERGLAAHWKYKTGEHDDNDLDEWFMSIKEMLDSSDYTNAVEFMDTFKLNLYSNEIYVFTPKGDIKKLPPKATALDFAFYLHSDIGYHCIGAKVDHKLVPLSYELQSGDQVEILTSNKQFPQPEWIEIATTAKARAQLRTILRKELKSLQKKGTTMVEEELQKLHIVNTPENIQHILNFYKFTSAVEFYRAVGREKVSLNQLSLIFNRPSENAWVKIWKLQFLRPKKDDKLERIDLDGKPSKNKTIHLTDAEVGTTYKIAECCHPIPGDAVLGFKDDNNTIIVHKLECPAAVKLQSNYGNRILKAEW